VSGQALPSFDGLVASLSKLGGVAIADPEHRLRFRAMARRLQQTELTRDAIAREVERDPELVPLLGLVVGLSQEALKNTLRVRLGTAGWVNLGRHRASEVVALLDEELALLDQLGHERVEEWEYGDILLERGGSRGRAGRAIGRGRALEDEVERLVGEAGLNLPYALRTQFVGTAGRRAPCDVAVPAGGAEAQIAIAVKGFDSTGSKLTDAAREVATMAEVRQPRQFIYAVVDGIGWHGRRADLRRIYDLWAERRIDGVFTLNMFEEFRDELGQAARRLGIVR
jgi:DpnII restriction endonuclease